MTEDTTPSPLRAARQRQDLSLREVASLSGLSLGYLSKIERGSKSPSLHTLRRLAPVLGLGPADLSRVLHASEPNLTAREGSGVSAQATKVCSVEGCDGMHYARGWCQSHYRRWRRHGDPAGGDGSRPRREPICTVEGCERRHRGHGYCGTHLYRYKRHGDPEGGEVRNIPDGYMTGRGMADLAGVTYRRLDYWANEGFIPLQGRGSGRFRLYSPEQQRVVCTFARLVDLGFRPEALAEHDAETQERLLDGVRRSLGLEVRA